MEIHPKTLEALETWWARRGLEPPMSRARKNASKRPEALKSLGFERPPTRLAEREWVPCAGGTYSEPSELFQSEVIEE